MSTPEYNDDIEFVEWQLQPLNEEALDLDFPDEEEMWTWYNSIISVLGNYTLDMAKEQPEDFRLAYFKVPFEYDLSELGNE